MPQRRKTPIHTPPFPRTYALPHRDTISGSQTRNADLSAKPSEFRFVNTGTTSVTARVNLDRSSLRSAVLDSELREPRNVVAEDASYLVPWFNLSWRGLWGRGFPSGFHNILDSSATRLFFFGVGEFRAARPVPRLNRRLNIKYPNADKSPLPFVIRVSLLFA